MAKRDIQFRVAKLQAGKAEQLISDGDGLYLRLRSDGSKAWVYQYTSPVTGKRPKLTLGHYADMSLEEARAKASEYRKQVAKGIDPKIEEKQAELLSGLAGEEPKTVRELFRRWQADWLENRHADKGAYVRGMLERHALSHLGDIELERLRAPHITATLSKINGGAPSRTAGVVLSNLRQMFAYAVEHGWLQGDPSAATKKSKWDNSVPRERVLSEEEIYLLAKLMPAADLPPAVECLIWISLSCLTRIEETSLARAVDVDLDEGIWRIPAENQKETRRRTKPVDHYVYLSPFAVRWFKRLMALPHELAERKNSRLPKSKRLDKVPPVTVDLLFPNRSGEKPISRHTVEHALADRQRLGDKPLPNRTSLVKSLVLPGGKFTPHDMRRTGATLMRELQVPKDVVEKCLNHAEPNQIVATYQHAKLVDEKRAAWITLGKRLDKLTVAGMVAPSENAMFITKLEDEII